MQDDTNAVIADARERSSTTSVETLCNNEDAQDEEQIRFVIESFVVKNLDTGEEMPIADANLHANSLSKIITNDNNNDNNNNNDQNASSAQSKKKKRTLSSFLTLRRKRSNSSIDTICSSSSAGISGSPSPSSPRKKPHPAAKLADFVRSFGYPCEEHKVTTEDGFILTVLRIPHGIKNNKNNSDSDTNNNTSQSDSTTSPSSSSSPPPTEEEEEEAPATAATVPTKKQVVFLQHGVMASAASFISIGPNSALGFILADAGYDVWLGNTRATPLSEAHTKYARHEEEYWRWTWADMASYDLPAAIGYVLEHTGASTLSYVGHSQGTTQAFVAFSTNAELRQKVNLFVALAPVVTLKHQRSNLFRQLSKMKRSQIHKIFGVREFSAPQFVNWFFPQLLGSQSSSSSSSSASSSDSSSPSSSTSAKEERKQKKKKKKALRLQASVVAVKMIALLDGSTVDPKKLPTVLKYEPCCTSVLNMLHWAQAVTSGVFRAFDHGIDEMNKKAYNGATVPPLYDLKNLTIPTALMYGAKDVLANPDDIEHFLIPSLPNVVLVDKQEKFGHLDYIWGEAARDKIYLPIVDLISRINRTDATSTTSSTHLSASAAAPPPPTPSSS